MKMVAPTPLPAGYLAPVLAGLLLLGGCGSADQQPEPVAEASSAPAPDASDIAASPISAAAASPVPVTVSPPPAIEATPVPATPAMAAPVAPPQPPQAFAVCRACHSAEPGRNGLGPTLFGIMGTKAGEVPGFAFTPALKASGVVWNRATLDTWLTAPTKMVPGTRMVIGVPNPEARAAIIDYLEKLQ